MNKWKKIAGFLISTSILSTGCGVIPIKSVDKLKRLQLGMSKADVKNVMGEPDEARASSKNDQGENLETWQYGLTRISPGQATCNILLGVFYTITWWFPLCKDKNDYWIVFSEEKLSQWGREGDLQVDHDIRLRIKNE